MQKDKLIDKINSLYNAGYNFDYPPLKELLAELDEIEHQQEVHDRLGEI